MALKQRYRRLGQHTQLRVLDGACIESTCWSPVAAVIGGKAILTCEQYVLVGCPPQRDGCSEPEADKRAREWVPV